ncbi:adenylyltransferase/cytidyltransferase family protein [Coprobacillaceae bacterium CR2/5/TPMF4]|nr:adenylyltransferase/cytidyltransferase family protein [Coprobacillaceae bacterium CR2/5/TPMF4]
MGTFDPVTNGHLDIIERASRMFDTLYVTICINPNKQGLFTVAERKELLKEAV